MTPTIIVATRPTAIKIIASIIGALFLCCGPAIFAKPVDGEQVVSQDKRITTTASGLKITTLVTGTGKSPLPDDTVLINYRLTTGGAEEYLQGNWQVFPARETFKGLAEAFTHMRKGGSYTVHIPASLGFGEYSPFPTILPNSDLEMSIEMLDFTSEKQSAIAVSMDDSVVASSLQITPDVIKYAINQAGVLTRPSGLRFKALVPGNGPNPGETDTVLVKYEGRLLSGAVFDSNEQTALPVSSVVPGFGEALQLMQKSGVYRIWIPPELGYGERSPGASIPANSWLVFDVTLQDFISASELEKLRNAMVPAQ